MNVGEISPPGRYTIVDHIDWRSWVEVNVTKCYLNLGFTCRDRAGSIVSHHHHQLGYLTHVYAWSGWINGNGLQVNLGTLGLNANLADH